MAARRRLGFLVFVTGSVCLGTEIAAARLLAPWFGASTIVWANTIAVVLVALSVGYAVGGRLADRNPTLEGLCRIMLVAAALLILVPLVSRPFLSASVGAFDSLSVGTFLGSLVGVCVLVAVPLLLLGTISPYAVRLAVEDVDSAGRVAGRLSAISTTGALVGTFAAALALIPFAGTRRTFLTMAAILGLAALIGLRGRWRVIGALVPAAAIVVAALPTHVLKAGANGERVIWEQETEYQYARVLQSSDGVRTLELNEGQAVHSLYRPGSYLTDGYWDDQLALLWAGAEPPKRVAILGNAAGTTARALGHFSPTTHIDGVEIDPAVTEAGRRYFDLKAPHLRTYSADARPWLREHHTLQNAIVVDAYRQPYVPFYLCTTEFFDLVRQRLAPGGIVVVNVGHPEGSRQLVRALSATMRSAFGATRVYADDAASTNTMLVGTTSDVDPSTALSQTTGVPTELRDLQNAAADRLRPAPLGGPVWTDDRAPVEWLVDLSLAEVATTGDAQEPATKR